jgi:hypothetical protein
MTSREPRAAQRPAVRTGRASGPGDPRHRARRRLALLGTVAVTALAIAVVVVSAHSSGPAARVRHLDTTNRRRPPRPGARPARASRRQGAARPRIAPGSLPQTHVYPSAHTSTFKALMTALWAGVVNDASGPALPAFFPKRAYEQLKAIDGAGADWTDRLAHDYRLDIQAAHSLLGAGARRAKLIGVDVSASFGHWISPGVCDNSIGYYEMPGARVVYSIGGRTRSFAIASMISWRGVWYVIHLGAVLRSSDTGIVDDPASGRGIAVYSGTC